MYDRGIYSRDNFNKIVSSYINHYERGGIPINLIMEQLQLRVDGHENTPVVLVSEDDSYKYLMKFVVGVSGDDINLESVSLLLPQ